MNGLRNARRTAIAILIGTLIGLAEAALGIEGIIIGTGAITLILAALLITERGR